MRKKSNGAVWGRDFKLPGLSGMETHSERCAGSGPGGEDYNEGTKEAGKVGAPKVGVAVGVPPIQLVG